MCNNIFEKKHVHYITDELMIVTETKCKSFLSIVKL